jgi:predicted metal-dependent hydrolase
MTEKIIDLEDIGPVTIYRNKRSTRLKITIKSGGEIKVAIPWTVSFDSGMRFLEEKRNWIKHTLVKIARNTGTSGLIQQGPLFSTRNFHYEVLPAPVEKIRIRFSKTENIVRLEYPEKEELSSPSIQEKLKTVIEGVLRFEARRYLPQRAAQLAFNMGYKINKVTVKNNTTNWGSCSSIKNINLNLHLMRLPDRVIDYIIIHELVHTVIPNHGPGFKATMTRYFPDIQEMERELKKVKIGRF